MPKALAYLKTSVPLSIDTHICNSFFDMPSVTFKHQPKLNTSSRRGKKQQMLNESNYCSLPDGVYPIKWSCCIDKSILRQMHGIAQDWRPPASQSLLAIEYVILQLLGKLSHRDSPDLRMKLVQNRSWLP